MPTTIDKNIHSISLSRKEGNISDEVQIILMTLVGNYTVNQQVQYTLANQIRTGYITSISKRLSTGGKYEQVLSILSLNTLDTLKSPKKTQKYITMSAQELYEFNRDYPKGSNYLDFNFKRKQGDNYGVGGWTCHQIITELASKIGYTVVIGTPDYSVKEFSVPSSTSYFAAILSLLSVFQPIIYLINGILIIVDGGVFQNNITGVQTAFTPQNVIDVDESIVKHDKISQLRVEGQMGKFNANNIKEYIVPSSTNPQTGWGLYQYPVTIFMEGGFTTWTFGWWCYGLEITVGNSPFFTNTSFGSYVSSIMVRALDVFGKPVATLLLYKDDRGTDGSRQVEINISSYENMESTFSSPRPSSYPWAFQETITYRNGFKAGNGIIQYTTNLFLTSKKYSYVNYNEFGEVNFQWMMNYDVSWEEDVTGEGKPKYTPFTSLEAEYPDESKEAFDTGRGVSILGKGVVNVRTEQEKIRFMRSSVYAFTRLTDREFMRIKDDKSIWEKKSDVDVQEGHLPASPIRYRLGPIYKEYNGSTNPNKNLAQAKADNTTTIDTPGITISAPSSNQADIDKIFATFWYRLNKDEVVRNYTLFGEVDLYPGMKVDIRTLSNLDSSEQLQTPILNNNFSPYISEYNLTKDFISGVSTVNITVKGKI